MIMLLTGVNQEALFGCALYWRPMAPLLVLRAPCWWPVKMAGMWGRFLAVVLRKTF